MSNIDTKLKTWVSQSLITEDQKNKILDFEKVDKKPALFSALIYLGLGVIAIGIISLIAANWDAIPGLVKIIVNFVILGGISWSVYQAYLNNNKNWFEGGLFAIFLMIGASIGLISQVFQLSGRPENAFLTWAIFSISLLVLSEKKIIPLFWVPLFLVSLSQVFNYWHLLDKYFEFFRDAPALVTAIVIMFFGVVVHGTYNIDEYFKKKLPIFNVLCSYSWVCMYVAAAFGLLDALFSYRSLAFMPNFVLTLIFLGVIAWFRYTQNKLKQFNFNIMLIGFVKD